MIMVNNYLYTLVMSCMVLYNPNLDCYTIYDGYIACPDLVRTLSGPCPKVRTVVRRLSLEL